MKGKFAGKKIKTRMGREHQLLTITDYWFYKIWYYKPL
jgi:hypothetical protein